jgi:hypothetical protein
MPNMNTHKTSKQNKPNPIAAARIDAELMREIKHWCDARGVKPSLVIRHSIELGWPKFLENPFAERTA